MKMGSNSDLTEREKEVLEFIVKGSGDKEIARNLFIAVTTVRTHIDSIFMKLGVSNRRELIIKVLREKQSYIWFEISSILRMEIVEFYNIIYI